MVRARDASSISTAGPVRVGLRTGQRPSRSARQPRRGRAAGAQRHLPGRLLRVPPDRLRRARLRLPEAGQTVVNVTDGKLIRLLVEDEPLDVHRAEVKLHERELDLRSGILTRRVHWTSPGRTLGAGHHPPAGLIRRIAASPPSATRWRRSTSRCGSRCSPTCIANESRAPASGRRRRPAPERRPGAVLQGRLHVHNGLRAVLAHSTRSSGLSVAAGMEHVLDARESPPCAHRERGRSRARDDLRPAVARRPLRLVKLLAYHWSAQQSVELAARPGRRQPGDRAGRGLRRPGGRPARVSRRLLGRRRRAARRRPRDPAGARFALFQVLQASARAETRAIAAKGLTGSGYDGHAFWDTESFVLPVLTYTRPQIVRDALTWRHSTLDAARERAHAGPGGCGAARGARSTARSARATGRPAPPRSTSTPTSPTRCAAT